MSRVAAAASTAEKIQALRIETRHIAQATAATADRCSTRQREAVVMKRRALAAAEAIEGLQAELRAEAQRMAVLRSAAGPSCSPAAAIDAGDDRSLQDARREAAEARAAAIAAEADVARLRESLRSVAAHKEGLEHRAAEQLVLQDRFKGYVEDERRRLQQARRGAAAAREEVRGVEQRAEAVRKRCEGLLAAADAAERETAMLRHRAADARAELKQLAADRTEAADKAVAEADRAPERDGLLTRLRDDVAGLVEWLADDVGPRGLQPGALDTSVSTVAPDTSGPPSAVPVAAPARAAFVDPGAPSTRARLAQSPRGTRPAPGAGRRRVAQDAVSRREQRMHALYAQLDAAVGRTQQTLRPVR